ncbi:RNA polymerase sigma factor [Brevibacillus ginsengisoli]|uniref:RNA polymerase sigma factor n=1 Tax=Brevibacillus ginsengisoli TaxID=363854 RepID=UPI003CEA3BB7
MLISKVKAQELFEMYSPFVFRMAYLITRSKTLADDAVQETFLRIYQKYDLFDQTKPIQPWISAITVNVTRNLLRKNKWQVLTDFFPSIRARDSVEDSYIQNETQQALWKLIQVLPVKSKEILVLRYYAELQLAEIATILQIPIGTCKSRLNCALKHLRKKVSVEKLQLICEVVNHNEANG